MLKLNNIEFSQQLKQLSGECPLIEMSRLNEMLLKVGLEPKQKQRLLDAIANTFVKYSLTGLPAKHYDNVALPMLMLELSVELPMICQRCLDLMQQAFALTYLYAIGNDAPEALHEDDDVDWLESDVQMDVQALIEDELIMAMPIAPMHGHNCADLKMQSGELSNPFASLKGKF